MPTPLAKALESLPHGPEFRFLDCLLSLVPGQLGTAQYQVRGDEPFLRGHFPGTPLFPGVLVVEAAAQLAGTVAQSDPQVPPLHDLKLAALHSVKITGSARPGETILLEAAITGRLGPLVQATVSASVNDRGILRGAITLSGANQPD